MKLYAKTACLFLLGLFVLPQASAQYVLDISNGLPADHIYMTTKDRYGYLWICTTKGIVKYNGYNCKKVFYREAWEVFEDAKGRMWLSNFDNEIGYIYHDSYHKAYTGPEQIIYRTDFFTAYGNGAMFTSSYYGAYFLCYERNDTIIKYDINKCLRLFPELRNYLHPNNLWLVNKDNIFVIGRSIYKLDFSNSCPELHLVCAKSPNPKYPPGAARVGIFNYFLLSGSLRQREFLATNLKTCEQRTIKLSDDPNEFLYVFSGQNKHKLYCFTNKNMYVYDSALVGKKVFSLAQLFRSDSSGNVQLSYCYEDAFWGQCLSSTDRGLQIQTSPDYFKKVRFPATLQYHYVGTSETGINYLWSEVEKKMIVEQNGRMNILSTPFLRTVQGILPYDSSKSLLVTYDFVYWIFNDGRHEDIFLNKDLFRNKFHVEKKDMGGYLSGFKEAVVGNDKSIFVLSSTPGLSHLSFHRNDAVDTLIDKNRYTDIAYDYKHNILFAYNDRKILVYNLYQRCTISIDGDALSTMNINNVDKILVDKNYGNILVKDVNNLFTYNIEGGKHRQLFPQIAFNDAQLSIKDSLLIVAGKFGILFSKITGPGKFSAPVVYYNAKAGNYYYVSDMFISDGQVILNTNKGRYVVSIPGSDAFTHVNANGFTYKLIEEHNNIIKSVKDKDTIVVKQEVPVIKFDAINPDGVGDLRFRYSISELADTTYELNGDELNLSRLKPGRYYSLQLVAIDDVSLSDKFYLKIYIEPFWWQTPWGERMLWIGIILFASAVIYLTIITTQRAITIKNAKKNRLMELELKSIYAQINPHFIFNTLTAGLHFIRKQRIDDAYNHLFRFSKLLRAYLKSSRNRYITLADEIANLKDYIELQQTRFGNVFSYNIELHNITAPGSVKIPSLLLQPIVENAINHGLLPKNDAGHLDIEFTWREQQLVCKIEDDGIGYDNSRAMGRSIEKESYGSDLIKELIAIFNEYERINITIEYIDKKKPDTGTIVILYISYPHGEF